MMINDDQWWPRPCKKGVNNSDNQQPAVTVQRSTERFRNRSQLIVIQLNFIQPSTIFVVALCKTTWRRFTSTRVKPTQSAMRVIVANCDSNPCFCSRWTLLADLSHKGLKQKGAGNSNSLDSLFPFTALCSWLGMELGYFYREPASVSAQWLAVAAAPQIQCFRGTKAREQLRSLKWMEGSRKKALNQSYCCNFGDREG